MADTDVIIAIKAFKLGRQLSLSQNSKQSTSAVLEEALRLLQKTEDNRTPARLVFYRLLLCELWREEPERIIELRKLAKEVAEQNESLAFSYYMDIVKATQPNKELKGIQNLTIEEGPIKITETVSVGNGFFSSTQTHDLALAALDVESSLTESERRFIFDTPLIEILRYHGLEACFGSAR